jgi:hypothetical protein
MWLPPGEALEKQQRGEIMLMPPTLKMIQELDNFPSIEAVFASAEQFPPEPVLPQAIVTGDTFGILLPHDPEYAIEAYKRPQRPGETSRIMMLDDKWQTICNEA